MAIKSSGRADALQDVYGDNRVLFGYQVAIDEDGLPDYLNSAVLDEFYNLTVIHRLVIDQSSEGAADLVAFNLYGTEELGWVVMLFNGMTSHEQLRVGVEIKMPERSSLFKLLSSSKTSTINNTPRIFSTVF